ncbi:MAG: DegT/DnrJ/EryC1/StrS family aminotransferase [Planctomycetes bacterium]|nr:DegT/DnrJ/EryC1/StrS family aminotransferase [Planctomycetota bacterium]
MWARKRLDIGWSDFAFGLAHCSLPRDRGLLTRRVETAWSPNGDGLACLSVRSGFDLLLTALRLPPGSEVVFSAITIPDMLRIVEHHGLVAVPMDLDVTRLSPSRESLRRVIGPSTRAVVAAHLFGSRFPIEPILEEARPRGVRVIEDCAQAYAGPSWRGHPETDASLFSFGSIKTATALGGALLRVRDPEILDRMRLRQASYPVQPASDFLRRLLRYSALKALSSRPVYRLLVSACNSLERDHDRLINAATRGFPGPGFFERIRRQPSAPLLALLERRLQRFDPRLLDRREDRGRALARLLPEALPAPGAELPHHTFWLFPVLAADPGRLILALRSAGFDATQGQSLTVVPTPPGRSDLDPVVARQSLARMVHLPCYPGMREADLRRMAEVLRREASLADE